MATYVLLTVAPKLKGIIIYFKKSTENLKTRGEKLGACFCFCSRLQVTLRLEVNHQFSYIMRKTTLFLC